MLSPEEFVAQLSERRKTLSLQAIGAELGVTRQAVHQWLSGRATPTVRTLQLAERVWAGPRDVGCGLPDPVSSRE